MEYNTALLEYIKHRIHSTDFYPPHVYLELWKHWPQINPQTKLAGADWHEINVAEIRNLEPHIIWGNKKGRKARLWRALGELFNRRDWIRRGQEYGLDPFAPPPTIETLHLERFGIGNRFGQTVFRIECVYHPQTDTFYIRDYRPVPTEQQTAATAETEALLKALEERLSKHGDTHLAAAPSEADHDHDGR